jgi:hypothetical protein
MSPTTILFIIFTVYIAIIICSKEPTEAILFLALITNFLVTTSILTKWNGDKLAASKPAETSPLNPPEGFYPGGSFTPTSPDGYEKLDKARAPNYGPRFHEYDDLNQSHLDMTPATNFPRELFTTADTNSKMSMDNIIRGGRVQRSIDDGLIRGASGREYLYAEELKEQEYKHWMSKYEY